MGRAVAGAARAGPIPRRNVLSAARTMALDYAAVKHLHMGAAALSLALFVVRGAWMIWQPAQLARRWVRIVPHVVDTVLLVSALWLAWQVGFAANAHWLGAKIVALAVYVVLGTIALRRVRRGDRDVRLHRERGDHQVAARAVVGVLRSMAANPLFSDVGAPGFD